MVNQKLKYSKRKEFLICVDSDGCAMDTMSIKHIRCFGPCMVREWELEKWNVEILERWNEINLYSMTRGINRFKGLAMMLREVEEKYCEIEALEDLEYWVEEASELSNAALEREIFIKDSICLRKALAWSESVNQAIEQIAPEDKIPFEGVDEALKKAHDVADIAVVSSANLGAVLDEWKLYGLLEHTDVVFAQDAGSKKSCIRQLLKQGYEPDHVLMCGDAPGDLDAAEENGVYYYPILVRREKESWEEFVNNGLKCFIDGTYGDGYQQEKKEEFIENLLNIR